jgi:hypothetical protein
MGLVLTKLVVPVMLSVGVKEVMACVTHARDLTLALNTVMYLTGQEMSTQFGQG